MNGWKLCAECGDPTLLSLYCDVCFKENFKKKARSILPDFEIAMVRIKELEKLIAEHKLKREK